MKLTPMNLQQLFDTVYQGLASQGWQRSILIEQVGQGLCAYRGDNGMRCAVGWVIPDFAYDKDLLEGKSVDQIGVALGFSDQQIKLLECLQMAHDSATSPWMMWQIIRETGLIWGLAIDENDPAPSDVPFPRVALWTDKYGAPVTSPVVEKKSVAELEQMVLRKMAAASPLSALMPQKVYVDEMEAWPGGPMVDLANLPLQSPPELVWWKPDGPKTATAIAMKQQVQEASIPAGFAKLSKQLTKRLMELV